MQYTSYEMLGWVKLKLESKLQGEISITSDNADYTTLMAESKGKLKNLLMKVKERKSWLKTQHSKSQDHGILSHQFTASRWVNMEIVTDFVFLGSKIAAHSDCSHKIKRHLLLGRKAVINLDSVLKSRDITCLQNSR